MLKYLNFFYCVRNANDNKIARLLYLIYVFGYFMLSMYIIFYILSKI
jgi:hypothetical protein